MQRGKKVAQSLQRRKKGFYTGCAERETDWEDVLVGRQVNTDSSWEVFQTHLKLRHDVI